MQAAFTLTPAMRARAATGYMDRWDPMRLVLRVLHPAVARRVYAARDGRFVALAEYDLATAAIGGLVGSVGEFARFVQAQLGDGGPVLSAASTRAMQTLVATGAAGIESRAGVGLGWKFGEVDGRPFLNHEGGGAGFTTELRIYPREGIGLAIAMNAMQMPRTMRVAHAISELVRRSLDDR
jgi:CubicO group peptidase (beta-lactamase class C family)